MARRVLALVMAALVVVMLASLAGHALRHAGHAHDCQSCPVCLVLCAFEKLMRRLNWAALPLLLLFICYRGVAALVRLSALPCLLCSTPVGLKVKLTN